MKAAYEGKLECAVASTSRYDDGGAIVGNWERELGGQQQKSNAMRPKAIARTVYHEVSITSLKLSRFDENRQPKV